MWDLTGSLYICQAAHSLYPKLFFGPPEGSPTLFLFSPEVSVMSGTMSIYICQQHDGHEVGT